MIEAERSEFTECDFEELAPRLAEEIAKAISTKPASNPEIRARAFRSISAERRKKATRRVAAEAGFIKQV